MTITLNGQHKVIKSFDTISLAGFVAELDLRSDRVAVELNGVIVPRDHWSETSLANGDRLEMVHFVGGGTLRNLLK